ncbi:MAG: PAS domain S-box protein, partial [Calditrichaceae bacterium]
VPNAVIVVFKGHIAGFNRGASELFKKFPGLTLNSTIEILYPEDISKSHKTISDICKTGKLPEKESPFQAELILKKSENEIFWAGISMNDITIDRYTFLMMHIQDLSQPKLVEESSKVFKRTFELANDAMIIHDENGRILLANNKACEILSYNEKEILKKNIADIDSLSTSMHWFEGDLDLEEIQDDVCEVFFLRKDQSLVPAESSVQIIEYQGWPAALLIFRDVSQRKEMERALYESLVTYQTYINTAPDSVLITDHTGKIKEVNSALSRVTNYSQGELLDMNFTELVVKEQRQKAEDFFRNLSNLKKHKHEFILEDKNGKHFFMLMEGAKISTKKYIWFGKDLTDIKEDEKALRENEAKYRALFDNTGTATIIIEKNNIISLANRKFAMLSGYSLEEIHKKLNWTVFIKDNALKKQFGGGNGYILKYEDRPEEYDVLFIDKNGQEKYVVLSLNTIPGTKSIVASFLDVTGKKNTEKALAFEKYLLHSLLDHTIDNVYFKDENSRFIRVSNSMAKYLNFKSPDDLVGKTDFDIFDIKHARPAFKDEQHILKTGKIISKEEEDILKDGTSKWVSTVKLPFYDERGKITGTFGISRDISQQKANLLEIQRLHAQNKNLL